MDLATVSVVLFLAPLAGIVVGVVIAGRIVVPALKALAPVTVVNAPPPVTALSTLPEITSYIDFYIKQLAEFRIRIQELEDMNKELGERADLLDARGRLIEQKLIAQRDHTDTIYHTLDGFNEGRGWASSFRQTDPRYAPLPPAVPRDPTPQ